MSPKQAILSLVTALCTVSYAHAAVVAEYDFTNTRLSTDTELNSSASSFANGSGFNTSTYYTSSPSSTLNPSLPTVSTITDGTSATTAKTANDYYEFTLTPNAGYNASLTDLKLDFASYGSGGSRSFAVFSSIDSFATSIGTANASGTSFATTTISLSAASFQNLTSAVTFRIYIWDDQNNSGKGSLLDNVILDGTLAAVPEPSTWAMMGLGAGLLGAVQRFRQKRR